MNKDVKIMLKIYKTKDRDWLGYKIYRNTPLTRHHIFKRVYGGPDNVTNYALLIEKSHQDLHKIEKVDLQAYNELNNLFRELNNSMQPPTEEYYNNIHKVLKRVRVKTP